MRIFLYYYFYSHTGKKHITKHRKILYSSIIQRGNFFLEKKDKTPFTYIYEKYWYKKYGKHIHIFLYNRQITRQI